MAILPTFHVAIVYEDGGNVTHAGIVQEHAQAIFKHARAQPQTVYAHIGTWVDMYDGGLRWHRLEYYIRPMELH
jgi:hypothetical protein